MFYGQVGTRCYVPTALGDNLQYQFQSGHDIYAPTAGIATLYFCEANFWVSNVSSPAYMDSNTGGTLTASMGVEYPAGSGTYYRAFWAGGATSATITDGTFAWAKATIPIPAGKSRINLIRRLQNSSALALNRQANGARRYLTGGDAAEQGTTDKTLTGGLVDSGGDYMVWPAAIVALTNGISVGCIGDSRTIGEGDTTPTDEHMGQVFHAIGPNRPYINHGVAGQPFVIASSSTLRRQILAYCTTIISVNGYNSRVSSASTMFAAQQQEGADMAPREFWMGTIYPGSSSTNGWTDTAHQTTDGFNANRAGFNDLVRATSKYVDPNSYIENSLDDGLWTPHTPGYTTDGVHANSAGALLPQYPGFAPSSVGLSSFMPSVAPV
jgi:hypothetical protein